MPSPTFGTPSPFDVVAGFGVGVDVAGFGVEVEDDGFALEESPNMNMLCITVISDCKSEYVLFKICQHQHNWNNNSL